MKLRRRQFLHLAAGVAALPALSRFAWAQAYPARPVHIVVPFAAGGSTDITARLIGQWLSQRLGQQFVIENRPGAGSNIGTEVVVNAPPDGYTLLLVGASSAINMTLYEKLNFNFLRDITPVAGIISIPFTLRLLMLWAAVALMPLIALLTVALNFAGGGDDPFTFPPARFHELPVELTIAGGQVVHKGPARAGKASIEPHHVLSGGACCAEERHKGCRQNVCSLQN